MKKTLLTITTNAGKKIVYDPKTPHVIVAGATGSDKSVFLNQIICSLLVNQNNRIGG